MADIAAVFHWPPDILDEMTPEDLRRWHDQARKRVPQFPAPRGRRG